VAIEVPEIVLVAVSLLAQADVILTPGPYKSSTDPKFEKKATLSEMSVAPTVIASSTSAGDTVPASIGSWVMQSPFPAATA
jgi:hypothetical protein